MSDNDHTWYWCDAPSPLHELLEQFHQRRRETVTRADALAKRVGARAAVGRNHIEGFVFDAQPSNAEWRWGGTDKDGERWYAPKRTSAARRELYKEMTALKLPNQEALLRQANLFGMRFTNRYMIQSVMGHRDGRIFVGIPVAGEGDGVDIPAYLTPCRKWEVDRFMEEGRGSRSCRVCGCTDLQACPGGCHWVGPDLCSACEVKS